MLPASSHALRWAEKYLTHTCSRFYSICDTVVPDVAESPVVPKCIVLMTARRPSLKDSDGIKQAYLSLF